MGHGWSGGLRPSAASLLPRHRRPSSLLRHRQPRQLPERHGQVGAGAEPLLSEGSRRTGRHENRPALQQESLQSSRRATHEARIATTGPRSGAQDQRACVHRVLSKDARGRAGGVQFGHQGGRGEEGVEQEDVVQTFVSASLRTSPFIGCRRNGQKNTVLSVFLAGDVACVMHSLVGLYVDTRWPRGEIGQSCIHTMYGSRGSHMATTSGECWTYPRGSSEPLFTLTQSTLHAIPVVRVHAC